MCKSVTVIPTQLKPYRNNRETLLATIITGTSKDVKLMIFLGVLFSLKNSETI
jgi:hypothetical protein